ncbi:MAG: hypothetical protein IT158_26090 [Bryobacterales bacterium]|nr:hypothetical protein [Bryobacterales bacterium]
MSDNSSPLERECAVYARYLAGQAPSPYVLRKYLQYHASPDRAAVQPRDSFDERLLRLAARGPGWARLADAYACRFARRSALRAKLVLLLGLLECSAPSFALLDAPDPGGRPPVLARLSLQLARFVLASVAGILLFTPLRALHGVGAWRPGTRPKWKESL